MMTQTFESVVRVVYERTGIVLDESKRYLVETRLQPVAATLALANVDALAPLLSRNGEIAKQVAEALTTNETSFFRDPLLFEALEAIVFPELIEARKASRRLRIWSAACSTGQEAYSIAMLLASRFPQLDGWQVEIVGTDINSLVVAQAREGLYSQVDVNRGLPAMNLVRFFEREGRSWRAKESIRRRVQFLELNLNSSWAALGGGVFDLVFLRNVLIYFDDRTRLDILTRARRMSASDGLLIMGGPENPRGAEHVWKRRAVGKMSMYVPAVQDGGGR